MLTGFFKKMMLLFLFIFLVMLLNGQEIRGKEYLKSLLLPGLGEITTKHNTGYALIASEILIWSSKWYVNNEKKLKDEQSFLKALEYAHINKNIKFTDSYADKLKRYMSSGFETGGYNQELLYQAIKLYPDDKEKQDEYIEENMIPDEMAWNWDSYDDKHDFSIMRKRIIQYSKYMQISTGLLIINRLASMIHLTALKKRMDLNVFLNDRYETVIALKYNF